jgi:hypothetical protein
MELEDEESLSSHEVAVIEKDETAAEAVAPLEPVTVPIVALKAALMVTGEKRTEVSGKKSDIPGNMQGVHIASREGEIRISATDGRQLFAYSVGVSSALELPRWLASGITISLQLLKEQLTMLEKVGADDAVVSYQTNAPHLLLSDPHNRVTFRTFPVAEAFLVYDNVFSGIDLSARTTVDLEKHRISGRLPQRGGRSGEGAGVPLGASLRLGGRGQADLDHLSGATRSGVGVDAADQ